ncbi:SAM-dependent methyltransferase [Nocardia xishanensis]|uniref:SAM-dependent methyltransferase n=1 Tax=Nocardia xishanensis TaxID=238964 RepID=UPI003420707B
MADKRPIRTDIPHSARIWNYWLGGGDYYEADRIAGEAAVAQYPEIKAIAMQSRQFLIRSVRYLAAEAGIRQFLDIGTGLPTMQNTHEVAQSAASDSKIVYVDNDPLVLAHARALLVNTTDEGVTTYLEADFHRPEVILADSRHVLNFSKPIAIMFIGVLGHARSYEEVRRVVDTTMDGVPSGSYLVLCDGATDDKAYVRMCENYAKTGGDPYIPRSSTEITGIFDGLELVEPGVVPIDHWRTDGAARGVRGVSAWGGVGRKP